MSVSFECCMLSGRGLCVGLIPRPEESHRVWCESLSVISKPRQGGGLDPIGLSRHQKKITELVLHIEIERSGVLLLKTSILLLNIFVVFLSFSKEILW
jgi:hypothetical protein